ncbi:MAG TPA: phosphatidate cytidylyltransferase [Candidatus Binatia bacterium]|nr:phosphatidate cytidylyltransferase [Candidatus Binatia bacterium]
MLKQRVITALLLLPLVLGAIWYLPTQVLTGVLALVILLAAREWSALAGVRRTAAYLAAMGLLLAVICLAPDARWIWWPVAGTCLWWLWMIQWVVRYPRGFSETRPPRWIFAAAGLLVVPGTIAAIALLHGSAQGTWKLLYALFVVWAADVGAYFAGRGFGRHKLSPQVSPGKTWEGALGGLLLAYVVAGIAGTWVFRLPAGAWGGFLSICTVVVAFSIIGDLGESLLKRRAGAKDSGTLLPGHGGLLDRIDSVLAALPAMAVGFKVFGL